MHCWTYVMTNSFKKQNRIKSCLWILVVILTINVEMKIVVLSGFETIITRKHSFKHHLLRSCMEFIPYPNSTRVEERTHETDQQAQEELDQMHPNLFKWAIKYFFYKKKIYDIVENQLIKIGPTNHLKT